MGKQVPVVSLGVNGSGSSGESAQVSLIISAYQPTPDSSKLLRVAIESALCQTGRDIAIWVVDGASPDSAHKVRPLDYPHVNFIEAAKVPRTFDFRRISAGSLAKKTRLLFSKPQNQGSYANGWGLDLGVMEAVFRTQPRPDYFMTLQMDVMFSHPEAIDFLLSKFSSDTAAVGMRPQSSYDRSEDGLHSLGCLWHTPKFLQLEESLLPDFPRFDVGEKAVSKARELGMEIVGLDNTYSDWTAESRIVGPKFLGLKVDRTLDDNGEVLFLHLGRGIPRSQGRKRGGVSIEAWQAFWDALKTANKGESS